ncbi:MAG: YjdF family protein [Clostridiales bacterium]
MIVKSKFTVLFEDPFWVGIYERVYDNKLEVARVVFGAEPKDYEVYEFLLTNWSNLRFSSKIKCEDIVKKRINPKRIKRQINKQLSKKTISTKAQEALRLKQEEGKFERNQFNKQQREEDKQRKFELKKQKKKLKHKGK